MKDVLLIESSRSLLASRTRTLEAEGYHVTSMSTAVEAAKIVRLGSCDLIIADAEVPGVLEVVGDSVVPALITADGERVESIVRELPLGIRAVLVKPFTAARLRQVVAKALERADMVKNAIQEKILLPLNNSDKLLVSEAEMDRFFRHVLEMTAAETEADGEAVLIMDEKKGELAVKAGLGMKPSDSEAYIRLAERVMKNAGSLVANDRREATPDVKQAMSSLGASALLAIPLLHREKAVGAIAALKTGRGARFTPASVEFLSILAKQAATATENANLFKSVERQRQEVEALLERAVQSQENERKRVAVEIHDGIGQQLVGALYRIQAFDLLLTQRKFDEARAEMEELRGLLQSTLGELRRVLAGLRPHSLDELGLISTLQRESERFTRETKTVCRFNVVGSPADLTPSQEAAIYRVVQEALTNIRKHAQATELNLELDFQPGTVSVTVSDNGRGFNPDQVRDSVALGHMGLTGMKERAEMMGGTLSIESSPGNGTVVVLHIPLTEEG